MENKKVFIYVLIDPRNNEIFYVGYTNNPKIRLNAHININGKKREKNNYKDNVIYKILQLGLKPEMKIIDECDRIYNEELKVYEHERLERYYIKKYREEGIRLTNLTDGGGDTNHQLKKRIFKYDQFGNYVQEYESISDAGIEHNINPTNIGHAVDQRIKKTSCGHYWFSSKENVKKFKFKITWEDNLSILQYSLNGEFIKEFKNRREAEQTLKIGRNILCGVLKTNGLKSGGGYLWFHKGNVPKIIIKHSILHTKEISQYSLNGCFIKKFNSIKEASMESNVGSSNIVACAKNKHAHSRAGEYIWKYNNELPNKLKIMPVLKYDKNNNLLAEYISVKEATRLNNLKQSALYGNLNGNEKTSHGFIWKYKKNN